MFPGEDTVVVYFEDTKQRMGSRCALDARMLKELETLLGGHNVVVK
jgi:DNA polymerase-3 subunit alpha